MAAWSGASSLHDIRGGICWWAFAPRQSPLLGTPRAPLYIQCKQDTPFFTSNKDEARERLSLKSPPLPFRQAGVISSYITCSRNSLPSGYVSHVNLSNSFTQKTPK